MVETSQQVYFTAVAVVSLILATLGYFLLKTLTTSFIFQKGITLYQQRDYQGAEAAFRRVIERQRSNDMVRLLLGNTLFEQNKLDEATCVFQELIDRSPKNVDAYLRLGEILIKQGKLEDATTVFRELIHRAPNNTEVPLAPDENYQVVSKQKNK